MRSSVGADAFIELEPSWQGADDSSCSVDVPALAAISSNERLRDQQLPELPERVPLGDRSVRASGHRHIRIPHNLA